jgi:hypothetical protein
MTMQQTALLVALRRSSILVLMVVRRCTIYIYTSWAVSVHGRGSIDLLGFAKYS